MWKKCQCKALEDYSNIYSMMDTLLLGECMEHYRDVNIKIMVHTFSRSIKKKLKPN
jgi:hypothetical protein